MSGGCGHGSYVCLRTEGVGGNDRMYYEQVYIDTIWQEFQIPPDEKAGGFKISQNHLHIWPKQTYMFIAIPSEVGS